MDLVEVAARDGLQNEQVLLSTADKVELIRRAEGAGLRRLEVASFVNPARVPQMADAEAVLAGLGTAPGTGRIGLVLNRRGMERALAARVDEVNYVVVVTETFSQRNQGMGTEASLATLGEVARAAAEAGMPCSVTLSAAFGCPFEGEVPLSRVVDVAERALDAAGGVASGGAWPLASQGGLPSGGTAGPPGAGRRPGVTGLAELALADTIGVAVPADVRARLSAVRRAVGEDLALRCHFHNTRNTGIASALAAAEAGVAALDASLGGIGGCPFAPKATGNIPTEDLVYALERSGIPTGVDLEALLGVVIWLGERLGRPVPGLLSRAGTFPARVT